MRATPARKARDEKRRDELQSQIQEDKLVEFQMMCDDGEADGCFNLAEWHAVVNKDHAKAAQMYLHNCLAMSHGPSCHHAALMYSAFTRRAMVCQQYAHAELFAPCPRVFCLCGGVAVNGRGVARSRAEGTKFMQKACQLDHPDGCAVAGMLGLRAAKRRASRGAGAGAGAGADAGADAGAGVGAGAGAGAGADAGAGATPGPSHATQGGVSALAMIRKGCALGAASACSYLGGLLLAGAPEAGLVADPAAAVQPLEFACDNSDGRACHNLAVLYVAGDV